ncbi:MAG: class I mannose-6-phosphate isomerase, partial [Pirellulales bacterium]|nr:class I mannose-6-phosphate isomerase [Pirellulales bacterium]
LGAGILIAEIQQASDTTFRLFDWNRPGPDGKPRPLHIDQGLEAVNFTLGPAEPLRIASTKENEPTVLVECDEFVLARQTVSSACSVSQPRRFCIVSVLEGSVTLEGDPSGGPLQKGQSALLPAALGPVEVSPEERATLILAMCPV